MLTPDRATATEAAAPARLWGRAGRAPVVAGTVTAVLGVAYLVCPPIGEDVSAQLFRASFSRAHPWAPINLDWFGGTTTFGYSLWAPLVMAWVGVGLTGVVCSVLATVQTTALLERGGAARPLVGGLLAALTQTINLVTGRITFSLGMVCGLGALLLIADRARPMSRWRWAGIATLAVLCGAGSPVAALLLWVCAATLALLGSVRTAAVLLVASLAPVVLASALFGDGGTEPFSTKSLVYGLVATVVVAVVVPRRTVRVGALVGLVMIVGSYALPTPVGDNSLRLSLLFALPVVGGFVTWRPWLATLAVVATAFPQQAPERYSFTHGPSGYAAYYRPLRDELRALGPLSGRVEIPETLAHWDAYFLGRELPLARGWDRQLDLRLNGRTLFAGRVSPAEYRDFLRTASVEYVAVPDADMTASGLAESRAVRAGLPFLRRVWADRHWSLWAVRDAVPIVGSPGRLLRYSADRIVVDAPANAQVEVSLRWLRWLTVSTGCIAAGSTGRVLLHTTLAGRYVISSSLDPSGHCAAQKS